MKEIRLFMPELSLLKDRTVAFKKKNMSHLTDFSRNKRKLHIDWSQSCP
jgi:hypothetical protein